MKKTLTAFIFFFITNTLLSQPTITSTFDTSAQGWVTVGDAPNVIHDTTGGIQFIKAHDLGNGVPWFWVAPPDYLGNKSGYYGGQFSYLLRTDKVNQNTTDDVIFSRGGFEILYTTANPTVNVWTQFFIQLNDTVGWKKDSAGVLITANAADIQFVLDSISQIKIRGEYSNVVGDWGALDFVIFQPPSITNILNYFQSSISFDVFPNPAYEFLKINCSKEIPSAKISISNMLSETLIQQQGNNFNRLSFDISKLSKGVYFITLITGKETHTKKFVKN